VIIFQTWKLGNLETWKLGNLETWKRYNFSYDTVFKTSGAQVSRHSATLHLGTFL
jgi:hypothetical protein